MRNDAVAILSVGDELILGQIEDTNAPWIARALLAIGVMPGQRRTVGDQRGDITAALVELARTHRAVIVSGGLGPTLDDLTREALADAIAIVKQEATGSTELVEDPIGLAHLRAWFEERGRVMPPSNRKQAMRPRACELLPNPMGTAPGLATTDDAGFCVYCLPGPPREMQPMLSAVVAPRLAAPAHEIATCALHTVGLGESALAELLGDLMDRTRTPSVGTTARGGVVSIRIRASGSSESARTALASTIEACEARVGHFIFGQNDATLASCVGALLRARGRTVATAESCTGGMVSALLTDVAGSSEWLQGGFVPYANVRKMEDLAVPSAMINEFGAVSHLTAVALARGALHRTGCNYAIATTGIAGPSGGSAEKPVGTVFIAIADFAAGKVYSRRFQFAGERAAVRERSAVMSLASLRFTLIDAPMQPLLWAEAEPVHVEAI